MRTVRLALLGVLGTSSLVFAIASCVGDSSATADSGTDSGQDSTTQNDSGNDVAVVDASDGGPTCILPDAAPGTLDLGFNNGVKVVGSSHFYTRAATVDSQGTVYVLGSASNCSADASAGWDFAILHILQNGSIDPVFAPNSNPLCLNFSPIDFGFAAAMLPGSGPLFGGSSGNGNTIGFGSLASVGSDAGPNKAFNLTGTLLLPQATGTVVGSGCGNPALSDTSPSLTTINGIAVSSAGKIAIVGSNTVNVCDPNDFIAAGTAGFVYQLNSDGTPDSAFNGGQPLKDTTVAGYYGVAFDAAGKLVVVGQSRMDGGASSYTASIRRFTATGSADGTLEVSAGGGMIGRAVAVLPDGHIMIAGPSSLIGATFAGSLTIMRLTSALALDTVFNGGFPMVLPLYYDAYFQYSSLEVLCDGAVLAAATYNSDSGADPQDMALVKLTPAGALDPSFGNGGIAVDSIPGAEIPVGVAQDPTTGKVVVVGRDTTPHLVIARFNP